MSPWLRGPVGLGEGGMGGREGREGRGTTALSLARSAGGEKPRGKRTVASGLGCGRGWRAQRARAEKNGTQSGAGRAARDTNSGAEPETQ